MFDYEDNEIFNSTSDNVLAFVRCLNFSVTYDGTRSQIKKTFRDICVTKESANDLPIDQVMLE